MIEHTQGPTLRQQNVMTALRVEMGWPEHTPANDCICFCTGNPMDVAVGMEMARISQRLRKDAIYAEWANPAAKEPGQFSVIYRELLTVDVVDRVVPFALDEKAPVILLSTRKAEFFVIDDRGSLQRVQGKPANIGTGRKLAMKRIKARAATLRSELHANNRHIGPGADWIEPEADVATLVRFN